jgi:hypothetical protein
MSVKIVHVEAKLSQVLRAWLRDYSHTEGEIFARDIVAVDTAKDIVVFRLGVQVQGKGVDK